MESVKEFLSIAKKLGKNARLFASNGKLVATASGGSNAEFFKNALVVEHAADNGEYDFAQSLAFGEPRAKISENTIEIPDFWHTQESTEVNEYHRKKILESLPFVSKDEDRFALTGIYFDDTGFLVATNGHIMYYVQGFFGFPNVILPVDSVLKTILQKSDAINIGVNGNNNTKYAIFNFKIASIKYTYIVQCIDSKYPDWKRIIPKPSTDDISIIPSAIDWQKIYKRLAIINKTNEYTKFVIEKDSDIVNVYGTLDTYIDSMAWYGIKDYKDITGRAFALSYKYLNTVLSIGNIKSCKAQKDFMHPFRFEYTDGTRVLLMPMDVK